MHFRLYDVNRTFAAVANTVDAVAFQVVQGDGGGHNRVHNAFGNFFVAAPQNRWVGHQVAHIAQEQHGAAMHSHFLAIHAGVHAVCIQATRKGFATFAHAFCQGAFQNTQPVFVGHNFVFSVYCCNRIFQVQNGGQRCFQHHVGHTGCVA